MTTQVIIEKSDQILRLLYKLQSFGIPFILEQSVEDESIQYEVYLRNINLFSKDMAWSPLDDSIKLELDIGSVLNFTSKLGNISFMIEITSVHGGKMIVGTIPVKAIIKNERLSSRFVCNEQKNNELELKSINDIGHTIGGVNLTGRVLDVSRGGLSVKVSTKVLPNLKKNSSIEISFNSEKTFLRNIKGRVKNIIRAKSRGNRKEFWRIGIQFDSTILYDRTVDFLS